MENLAQQVEEIEALSAIYGQDFVVIDEGNRIYEIRVCNENDSWWSATLQVLLPPEYPEKVPPVFEIHSAWMNDAEMFESSDLLHTIYRENQGEIVLYQWVEALRTFIDGKFKDRGHTDVEQLSSDVSITSFDDEEKSSEEKHDCDKLSATVSSDALKDSTTSNALKLFKSSESDSCPEILHGEPFTDRKSTFQAHLAHVVTADQVKQVLEELKKNRKVNNATHNVMAYRIFCENRNSFLQDCDDDGEAAAGSRLLHLLQILNIKNIIIVVTRWYGGILLGPDRFKHYNNCARGLLKISGLVEISPDLKDSKSKSRIKIKKH